MNDALTQRGDIPELDQINDTMKQAWFLLYWARERLAGPDKDFDQGDELAEWCDAVESHLENAQCCFFWAAGHGLPDGVTPQLKQRFAVFSNAIAETSQDTHTVVVVSSMNHHALEIGRFVGTMLVVKEFGRLDVSKQISDLLVRQLTEYKQRHAPKSGQTGKLSPAQQKQLVELYDQELSQAEIARRLGCHRNTVANYLNERGR